MSFKKYRLTLADSDEVNLDVFEGQARLYSDDYELDITIQTRNKKPDDVIAAINYLTAYETTATEVARG